MLHARSDREALKKAYPNLDNFWEDITKAYREEIADLYKAGCRTCRSTTRRSRCGRSEGAGVVQEARRRPEEGRRDVHRRGERGDPRVPDDMTVAIHTCRGNFKSTWLASGGYADFVAERVFTGLDVDGFFLEYDDERSGGFEPLRLVPKGKKVVLGLVSSKLPELEAKDTLKRRIDAAAKYVADGEPLPLAAVWLSSTQPRQQPHRRSRRRPSSSCASTPPAKYGAALKTHSGYLHLRPAPFAARVAAEQDVRLAVHPGEPGKRSSATSKAT